jgi:hypothetical protein
MEKIKKTNKILPVLYRLNKGWDLGGGRQEIALVIDSVVCRYLR